MRVGVVVSSWHYFADPFKLQPLYELFHATIASAHGLGDEAVTVYDLREWRRSEDVGFEAHLDQYVGENDLYFYWVMKTADYPEVEETVRFLRRKYPRSVHVAGGTHIDVCIDECAPVFDAVLSGPGDRSLCECIDDHRAGRLKRRYTDDWRRRPYSAAPYPWREFLPEHAVVNTELFRQYGGVPATSAMLQRGCCFRCAYCAYNVPSMIQRRTPEQVVEEVAYLKEMYQIGGLNLRDEIAIPLNPRVAEVHFKALGECGLIWRGQTKVGAARDEIVPREIIALAAETGCVELAVGVESASQQVLDVIDKRQRVEVARDFIIQCRSCGIKIKMCLILGLPGEPPDIVERTLALIEEAEPDFVNVSGFCPVPGSPIFERPSDYGIKSIDRDWRKHAHLVFRYSDEEDFGLPFEYEENGPWGRNFTRDEIVDNIKALQKRLRARAMVY